MPEAALLRRVFNREAAATTSSTLSVSLHVPKTTPTHSIRSGYGSSAPEMASENEYEYQPLLASGSGSPAIRLLELLPGEGSQPFQVNLFHSTLDEKRPYEALSYVWGDSDRTQQLHSGERILPITQSVYEALNALRLSDSTRTLWIDAVCINQYDTEERNAQVRLMRDIYAEATRVTVWLGPEDEDSKETLAYIRAACELKQDTAAAKMQVMTDRFSTSAPTIDRRLESLARRSWFSRAWVVQEFCVARNPVIRVGALTVSVEEFSAAFDKLFILESGSSVANQPCFICDTRHEFQKGSDLDAVDLVDVNRDRKCKDPRDKNYSMLGMFPSHLAEKIMPDYRDSVEKVYIDFAKLLMQEYDDLYILHFTVPSEHSADPGRLGLPTWVPDWRGQWTFRMVWTYYEGRRLFDASGQSEKWMQWMENDRILCLKASMVDTIAAVCEYQFPFYAVTEADDVSKRSGILREWAGFCLRECHVQCSDVDANGILEAFWRSMVQDLTVDGIDVVTPGEEHRLDASRTLAELDEKQPIDGFPSIPLLEAVPPDEDGGTPPTWLSEGWDFIDSAAILCGVDADYSFQRQG